VIEISIIRGRIMGILGARDRARLGTNNKLEIMVRDRAKTEEQFHNAKDV
jgi:hypothetical protein